MLAESDPAISTGLFTYEVFTCPPRMHVRFIQDPASLAHRSLTAASPARE